MHCYMNRHGVDSLNGAHGNSHLYSVSQNKSLAERETVVTTVFHEKCFFACFNSSTTYACPTKI